ncbi:MAG: hypothetical protein ACF8LL_13920 [Phycisphaerales bacterium]
MRVLEQSGLAAPAAMRTVRSSAAWTLMTVVSGLHLDREWIVIRGAEQDPLQEIRLRRHPSGSYSMVAEMKPQLSASLRDEDRRVIQDLMLTSCMSLLTNELNMQIADSQCSEPRVHRWGLARPLTQVQAPYLISSELDLSFAGDWLSGPAGEWRDAEAAFLSGHSLADYVAETR